MAFAAAFAMVLLLAPFLCLRNTPAPQGHRVVASAAPAAELAMRSSDERASRSAWRARDLELVRQEAPTTAPPVTAPPATAGRRLASTPAPTVARAPLVVAPKPAPVAARPAPTAAPTTTAAPKPAPRPTTTTTRPAPTTTAPPPPPAHSQTGQASWYSGPDGECANNQAPMGAVIRVTNLDNGRSTTCRVASRGPYTAGRVVDLTKTTFARIADPSAGVCRVRVEW